MEIDRLMGLPAHALIVHAAVVLVPLAMLALVVTGWRAPWRQVYALPVALLAAGGAFFAILAAGSGEPLEHRVRDAGRDQGLGRVNFGDHPEEGEMARTLAAVFALTAIGLFLVTRYGKRWNLPEWAPTAVYAVAALAGLGATGIMVAAGHSGAELVWKDVGSLAAGK